MATTEVLQHIPGLSELEEQGDLVIVGHTEAYTRQGVLPDSLIESIKERVEDALETATASGYYRGTELDGRLRRCGVTYCGI